MTKGIRNRKHPCEECPWRQDVTPGQFPAERYRQLAVTARDLTRRVFACHKSIEGKEVACAGYLVQFPHNLSVRIRGLQHRPHTTVPLYRDYREMAVANGVDPNDPALAGIRGWEP